MKIPFLVGWTSLNIHKSQLFWCEEKGVLLVLTQCHIWSYMTSHSEWQVWLWHEHVGRREYRAIHSNLALRRGNLRRSQLGVDMSGMVGCCSENVFQLLPSGKLLKTAQSKELIFHDFPSYQMIKMDLSMGFWCFLYVYQAGVYLGMGSRPSPQVWWDDPAAPGDSRIGHVFRSEFPYEINKTEPGLIQWPFQDPIDWRYLPYIRPM